MSKNAHDGQYPIKVFFVVVVSVMAVKNLFETKDDISQKVLNEIVIKIELCNDKRRAQLSFFYLKVTVFYPIITA